MFPPANRRVFLGNLGRLGLGAAALSTLLQEQASAQAPEHATTPGLPHHPPKAKRVISLVQSGGPSQMDLFDYKPKSADLFNRDLPESVRMGQRLTTMTAGQEHFPIAPSIFQFAQHGRSGAWVSEILPH